MTKYKLIGLTTTAEMHLIEPHLKELRGMIGCEVTQSEERSLIDNSFLFKMPDGDTAHRMFLVLEKITQNV